ncbi:hypothetical protein J2I47_14085 [Fibrella sp. HMF5335]|uniref:Uncharacterized protein n=1 Tax=Fibrella rubiginis TaxID=2817060 RepID=A0A939GJP0_9BACT|nr:hypothetical protein [Fibrella rubiginis]MBO0937683.1 hypothetical protein [Fibrella rubiginis]
MPPETLIPLATKYVTDLILENEEVKKFPQDFVTAGMLWVRSWFLKPDDPVTKTIVESETQPVAVKEAVLAAKLSELIKNPQFVEELKVQLAAYAQHSPTAKNIIDGADIDITGSVHIGDKTDPGSPNYDQKNIVKGGTVIKARGDFRLGDG